MGLWRLSQPGVVARLLIGAAGASVLMLAAPAPAAAATPYFPTQLRSAYDVPTYVTGAGETIVIIAGYQSPSVASDLARFDLMLGLPAANLDIVAPDGTTTFNPDPQGPQFPWAVEESSDVEWAHAIAPDAHLILVEARTGADADILSAIQYAIDHNVGDVMSMSFSEAETCATADLADQHAAFLQAVAQGITLVASSGDHGPMQATCDGTPVLAVGTPASDPLVTAVGGSDLTIDPSTGAASEVEWSGSGGGFSTVYARPGYQAPFQKDPSARGVPDVALSAGISHKYPIVLMGGPATIRGTSVATSEWAGIVALADQAAGHRLGAMNEALYHAAKSNGEADRFHDLSGGKHAWDTVTGLGTPDVANLVAWIAKTN